jgi:hypothetical protein
MPLDSPVGKPSYRHASPSLDRLNESMDNNIV